MHVVTVGFQEIHGDLGNKGSPPEVACIEATGLCIPLSTSSYIWSGQGTGQSIR